MERNVKEKKHAGVDLNLFGSNGHAKTAKMYEDTLKPFTRGAIVKGKVLEIRDNEVLVDIGYKSEGLISIDEFRGLSELKPNDEVEVLLEEIEDDDGNIVLSREKAEQKRTWDSVLASANEGSVLEGEIKSRIRGGLIVDINGVNGFLPGSQIDIVPVRNVDDYIGKTFEFKIMKISRERRNIVLSRRELLEQRRQDKRKQLLGEIQTGQVRPGVVKNITDFGAFIDLGGLDGLLHITDMSWGRISHPSKILKVGEPVDVMVLNVDLERERVSLGLKQKTPNPWDGVEEKYPVGSRVQGKVVNLVSYGAFIEIEEGIEGLVHVSEISWVQRVTRASDVLSIGEEVEAVVLNINREDQKISLGIRQAGPNPWDDAPARYPVGSRVKGRVRNFTSYGAFVELEEGIDGMVHVSDMSWTKKINHPSEVLKKDSTVEVVILEVDPKKQRISLGLKQAQEDPWTTITSHFEIGQIVECKVIKLAAFGAFVELGNGVDGLVHVSQISDEHVENARDALQVGQTVKARVIKIDPIERRIALSIKAVNVPDEEFSVKEEMLQGLKSGETLLDLAGAFDEAFQTSKNGIEEWRPGEGGEKKEPDKKKNDEQGSGPPA